MSRISRWKFLMDTALILKRRGTCARRNVGAVAAREGRILATGYNGAPSGMAHCIDRPEGCRLDSEGGCLDTIHAEANLVAFAARWGISIADADIYTTCAPCLPCAKLLINCKINSIVYYDSYRKNDGVYLLRDAGIKIFHYFEDEVTEYE